MPVAHTSRVFNCWFRNLSFVEAMPCWYLALCFDSGSIEPLVESSYSTFTGQCLKLQFSSLCVLFKLCQYMLHNMFLWRKYFFYYLTLRFVKLLEASRWIRSIPWSLLTRLTCSCRYIKLYFWKLIFCILVCTWILYHIYLKPPIQSLSVLYWVTRWAAMLYTCYIRNIFNGGMGPCRDRTPQTLVSPEKFV